MITLTCDKCGKSKELKHNPSLGSNGLHHHDFYTHGKHIFCGACSTKYEEHVESFVPAATKE